MTTNIYIDIIIPGGINVNRQIEMGNEKLTLTVAEVAKCLGVGRNSAYEAIARCEIPVIRVGKRLLVPKAALETLLAAGQPRKNDANKSQ